MKTEEDKSEEAAKYRAERYKREKQQYVCLLLKNGTYLTKYRLFPSMIKCPFCGERMRDLHCKYCLAKFRVVKDITEENVKAAAEQGYFLIKSV